MSFVTAPKRIDYLLYVAGVNIPCVSVAVQCSSGMDTAASVVIPPHPVMFDFGAGDKVQAAVFYLDSWYHSKEPKWCLLFEGYVSGCEYSYTAIQKSMTLSITSNIKVLSNLYLEFLGGGLEASSGKVGKSGKIIPNQITFRGRFPGQLFTVGMDNKTNIRAPYEFFQNILLATTGKYKDKDLAQDGSKVELTEEINRIRSLSALNYQNKLNSLATEADKKLFENSELELARSRAKELGLTFTDSEAYSNIQDKVIEETIKSLLKQRSLNDRNPVATGFFARFINITKLHKQVAASPIIEGFIGDSVNPKYKTNGMPTGVFPLLRTKNGSRYTKHLAKQSGFKYGDNGSAYSLINNMFTLFSYDLQAILAPPAYDVDDRGLAKSKFTGTESSNIVSFISKPKTLFSFPPACNIIFPSMVASIQYSSAHDQMPTRVYYNKISQLRKLNVEQKNGDGYAYMDSQVGFPAAIARHAYDSTNSKKTGMEVLVFPEEYYAGPKTVYTQLDPFISELDKLEKSGRIKDTSIKVNNKDYVDYGSIPANQAAFLREAFIKADSTKNSNYGLFMKQAELDYNLMRSTARSCSVSMPFNPYIVVGYSAIVCDSEDINNHIIGTVTAVQHSLSQGASATTLSMSACRSLTEMFRQCLLDGAKYEISPIEPITEIRAVLQDKKAANFYYGNALYRDSMDEIKSNGSESDSILQKRDLIAKRVSILEQEIDETEDDATLDALNLELSEANSELLDINNEYITKIQGSNPAYFKAVADYTKLFSLKDPLTGKVLSIDISNPNTFKTDYAIADIPKLTYAANSGFLVANPDIKEIFSEYDLSMDYCSRPVCTLEQYIDFYKGHADLLTSNFTGGRGKGCRISKRFLDNRPGYAQFYSIIREFVGGPGVEPGSKLAKNAYSTSDAPDTDPNSESSSGKNTLNLPYIAEGDDNQPVEKVFSIIQGEASATQLPDLAKDWQNLLLTYSLLITNKE